MLSKKIDNNICLYIFLVHCLIYIGCTNPNSTIPTIHIEVENCEKISTRELLHYISYTSLESPDSVRIGEINKLIPFEDRYYILDNQATASVYCFEQNGTFLFRLDQEGAEEGQYKYLENIAIDPYRRYLEVYDRGGLKLVRYDLDGNFIEEIPCPYYFEDFVLLNSSQYTIYGLGISNFFSLNDTNLKSILLINRKLKKEIQQGLPYIEPLHNVFFEGRLFVYEEKIWITYGFQDTIYQMDRDTLSAAYYVDFGKAQLPESLRVAVMESDSAMDRLVELLDAPYAKGIHHLLRTDDLLSFDFRTTNKHHFQGLYNFNKQESLCMPNCYFADGLFYQSPIALEVDTFISVVFAEQLLDSLGAHTMAPLSSELDSLKDLCQPTDNPIVIRMLFKGEF